MWGERHRNGLRSVLQHTWPLPRGGGQISRLWDNDTWLQRYSRSCHRSHDPTCRRHLGQSTTPSNRRGRHRHASHLEQGSPTDNLGNFGQQLNRCGSSQAKCCIFLGFGTILDLRPQKVAHDPGASFEHLKLMDGQRKYMKLRKKRSANFLDPIMSSAFQCLDPPKKTTHF